MSPDTGGGFGHSLVSCQQPEVAQPSCRMLWDCSQAGSPLLHPVQAHPSSRGMAQDSAWEWAVMPIVCSANQSSVQCPLPCPAHPLPYTLYLQDEAAVGHSCPAGDNAGVESSIRELCLGDPNPRDITQGWGGDVSSG